MSLLEPATWAQDATGEIAGNITDPSGAVVPSAMVIVTNLDTKTAKQAATDSQGFYQVLQLPIGRYEVSAEAAGFSESVSRPANPLEINQTLRVDITLQVGAAHTQLTVESRPARWRQATPPSAARSRAKPSTSFLSMDATRWICWRRSPA